MDVLDNGKRWSGDDFSELVNETGLQSRDWITHLDTLEF